MSNIEKMHHQSQIFQNFHLDLKVYFIFIFQFMNLKEKKEKVTEK